MSFWKNGTPTPSDFKGSCVVCLQGTDTALGFAGSPEWCAAALQVLGVPEDQALRMMEAHNGSEQFPDYMELPVRVCAACVERCPASFPRPVLALPGVQLPTIRPAE